MWCSSITFHPSTCSCREPSCSPFNGGTPPRHGTQVLVARSDMVGSILALGAPGLGRKERQRGRGLRTRSRAGVEFRAIGNVFHRGPVMGPADLQRYRKLLLEKRRELSSAQERSC